MGFRPNPARMRFPGAQGGSRVRFDAQRGLARLRAGRADIRFAQDSSTKSNIYRNGRALGRVSGVALFGALSALNAPAHATPPAPEFAMPEGGAPLQLQLAPEQTAPLEPATESLFEQATPRVDGTHAREAGRELSQREKEAPWYEHMKAHLMEYFPAYVILLWLWLNKKGVWHRLGNKLRSLGRSNSANS